MQGPSPGRGGGRPVKRRTRTFRPNYLSFAGTYQCNLTCAHCCVPIEWPDRLDIAVARRFLEDAHAYGIEVLGFTGGEPFLYPEFVLQITKRAAELGFRFDKIVTNGVWFENEAQLVKTLRALKKAGYTGKLGLSVDKFHGSHTQDFALFCRTARKVFERDNVLSLSYASRRPDQGLEPVHALARELDAVVAWSDLLHRYLLVSPELTMTLNWNHLAPVERAERLSGAWDGQWFEEDYCEGPGQALIVNPKGEVKPCCGFASDLDQLTIGNIHTDTVAQVVRQARAASLCRQSLPRGPHRHPRRNSPTRSHRPARRHQQPLLLLLARPDPRPRRGCPRRRRPSRQLDRHPPSRTPPTRPPQAARLRWSEAPAPTEWRNKVSSMRACSLGRLIGMTVSIMQQIMVSERFPPEINERLKASGGSEPPDFESTPQ